MRKKLVLMTAICSMLFAVQSVASDDIYVDLSVLDEVPQDSIGFVDAQPLFPKVKKIAKPVIVKKSVQPKKVKKEEIVKPVEDENIIKQDDKVEEKIISNVVEDSKVKDKIKSDKPDNDGIVSEVKAPEVVINNEITTQTEQLNITSTDDTKQDTPKTISSVTTDDFSQMSSKAEAVKNTEVQLLLPQTVMSANKPDVAISEAMEIQPKELYVLRFVENSSELTADARRKIDDAIKKFDIEKKKKISIKAYNYDNGTDSFQKKRISLMRATEVRSYFLNQGFKNFSIKVINNTTADEYKNTVQFEELD